METSADRACVGTVRFVHDPIRYLACMRVDLIKTQRGVWTVTRRVGIMGVGDAKWGSQGHLVRACVGLPPPREGASPVSEVDGKKVLRTVCVSWRAGGGGVEGRRGIEGGMRVQRGGVDGLPKHKPALRSIGLLCQCGWSRQSREGNCQGKPGDALRVSELHDFRKSRQDPKLIISTAEIDNRDLSSLHQRRCSFLGPQLAKGHRTPQSLFQSSENPRSETCQ